MIDLTHFLFNSISLLESTATTQEVSDSELPIELSNESLDQDKEVDPSSFVLLFADILANSPENNESKSKACGSSSEPSVLNVNSNASNTNNLQTPENTEIKTNEATIEAALIEQDKPTVNTETIVAEEDNHATDFEFHTAPEFNAVNNSINTTSGVKQLPIDVLENNVAMAWINSEHFLPPQSTPLTEHLNLSDKLEYDALSELEEFDEYVAESDELIELTLKKEIPLEKKLTTESSSDEFLVKTQSNLPKHLHAESTVKNNLFTLKPEIKLEPAIDNMVFAGTPDSIQSPALSATENQSIINNSIMESLDIPVDISDSQWAEKFSEHIVWLGQQGLKTALIKIHPEDLGPLEISIKVVKDSASVSIHSQSSHVCDIVDQALPRLREMMAEQGLNLSDVYVGADDSSRQFSQNNYNSDEVITIHTEEEVQTAPLAKTTRDGLIDYFA